MSSVVSRSLSPGEWDGLLPIHKPKGMISKDVSRWLSKRIGRVKLGHVGTLDPAASGVLPILLGRATRLQDYMLDLSKAYEFDMQLGFETDTLDMEGKVIRECPWSHVTDEDFHAARSRFLGEIEQIPPIYSAVKYQGKALYDYARSGVEDRLPLDSLKRKVCIESLEFLAFSDGVATFRVSCSKGTYIRTLVKDIAETIGSCATLVRLVRTEAAGIKLAESKTLDEIESCGYDWGKLLIPMRRMSVGLPGWQAENVAMTARLKAGQQVALSQESFRQGMVPQDHQAYRIDSKWLLLDTLGDSFGLGVTSENMAGDITIQMKRGF